MRARNAGIRVQARSHADARVRNGAYWQVKDRKSAMPTVTSVLLAFVLPCKVVAMPLVPEQGHPLAVAANAGELVRLTNAGRQLSTNGPDCSRDRLLLAGQRDSTASCGML